MRMHEGSSMRQWKCRYLFLDIVVVRMTLAHCLDGSKPALGNKTNMKRSNDTSEYCCPRGMRCATVPADFITHPESSAGCHKVP